MSTRKTTKTLGESGSITKDGCRYDPEHPEHHAQSAKAAAEDWGPQHAHPEDGDTYRQEDEPCEEQRVEHALVRLPQEDECRLILGGRPGRVIEVGDTGGNDVRESSGREHYETQNADDASKESRREARLPESAVQSEEEGDPHDEDQQVEAVLYGAGRSDVGEPFDGPVEAGRIRSHDHAYENEDENHEDATQYAGQSTPSQNAFLLYCFHEFPPWLL